MKLLMFLKQEDIRSRVVTSWRISWPMTLIMFFLFLIHFVDVYVAGLISKEIQATYGFISQLYFVMIVIAIALSVGTVSVTSRLFTSVQREELAHAVFSAIMTALIAGGVLALCGILCARPIISCFNVPQEIKELGIPLLRLYSIGLAFHYVLITTNAILRACHLVKKSLKTMGRVCLLNIILNFVLVLKTPLGYKGIAVATALSVFVGGLLNLVYIRKLLHARKRFSLPLVKKIVAIGWPIGLLQVLWQTGLAVLFMIIGALPLYAIETMAAFTNGLRIESMIYLPAFAFNMANAAVVGNLLGEGRKEEAFHNGITTGIMGVVIISIMTCIVMMNVRFITPFLSHNTIVIEESTRYLYIVLLSQPFFAWAVILGGALNGAGDTKSVMKRVAFSTWGVRIPLSVLFVVVCGMQATAVWWTMNLSALVHAALITKRYFSRRWLDHA